MRGVFGHNPKPRTVLLFLLILARGGTFLLEQPNSSLMRHYFRFQWFTSQIKVLGLHEVQELENRLLNLTVQWSFKHAMQYLKNIYIYIDPPTCQGNESNHLSFKLPLNVFLEARCIRLVGGWGCMEL